MDVYDGEESSAGIVTGLGVVQRKEVMIVANDATVKAAPTTRLPSRSTCAPKKLLWKTTCSAFTLVDSGGAFLPMQAEVFPDRDHFGRIFYNQAQMSALGIPPSGGGHGVMHRRRGVHSRHERRGGDSAAAGHHLSRRAATGRAATGEGGRPGDPGRGRCPYPDIRSGPTTRPPTIKMPWRSPGTSSRI